MTNEGSTPVAPVGYPVPCRSSQQLKAIQPSARREKLAIAVNNASQTIARLRNAEEETTRVALIHGIGATSRQEWADQSVQAIANWWSRVDRSVEVETHTCPSGCGLAPGHVHLQLSSGSRSRPVVLEPLYWADDVSRPSAIRCARLVLRVGLLIGLVDIISAWLTLLEQPLGDSKITAMTRGVARLLLGFFRALLSPVLALVATCAVLVSPRMRASIGDAIAWTLDADSHERVLKTLTSSLEDHRGPLVLIGHSQGGSIAATLAPGLPAVATYA